MAFQIKILCLKIENNFFFSFTVPAYSPSPRYQYNPRTCVGPAPLKEPHHRLHLGWGAATHSKDEAEGSTNYFCFGPHKLLRAILEYRFCVLKLP